MDTNNTVTGEIIESVPTSKKTNLKRNILIGVVAVLAILVIYGVVWFVKAVGVYKNSAKYKVAHDIVLQEYAFCNDQSKWKDQDPVKIVHYCDELKSKFQSVNKEVK